MPIERKTDLRIQKTKNAIKETFKEMICEMETKQEIAWAIKETALREALKRQ